MKNKKH